MSDQFLNRESLETLLAASEKELSKTQERLREALRARELLEKQLYCSQKLETLGKVSAEVAHEINNPLSYITSNLMFIRDSLEDLKYVGSNLEEIQTAASEAIHGARRSRHRFEPRPIKSRNDSTNETVKISDTIQSALKIALANTQNKIHTELNLEPN
jgi:signal transduction histidine kinase